jgi:CRP-like cAMP-binding protein
MLTGLSDYLDAFIAKIEVRERLTEVERVALRGLPRKVVQTGNRTRIVEEGERPTQCCLVASGMVFRSKLSLTGGRQILSFHVPGDMVDLQTILFKTADHTIETTRNTMVVLIPHEAVLEVAAEHPALARAFWFDTLVDASIQRETMLNIGRRDARARTAHLLCELVIRLRRAGADGTLPIDLCVTQSDLADSLGITSIHMNRVLARLRREGLITLDGRMLTVNDWQGLSAAGEFDPIYLHLAGPEHLHR